ncbi:MAG: hypothetical protein KDE31_06410, partial [Caldilineaceae bacterium]|nr:hypothetical protein [Caldilineaceae bacterium]
MIDTLVPGQIKGKVFNDIDMDGTADFSEKGVAGITVTAYNDAGTAVSTATTDAAGNYTLAGLTDGTPYRIEFTNLPSNLQPGLVGTNSSTTVVFANSPALSVDLAVHNPADYCANNGQVMSSCYIAGDQSTPTHALVALNSNRSGALQQIAFANQIGPTWGLAFKNNTNTIFASALLKRHVAMGPQGIDAIYTINYDPRIGGAGTLGTPIKLSALGVNVGANPRTVTLPSSTTTASYDQEVFPWIGKRGIGDVDLSLDGNTLYAVNLNSAAPELVALNVTNPNAVTLIGKYAIGNPGCSNNEYQPFALEVNASGNIFIGITCTAQTSQLRTDLRAYIRQFNPGTGTFSAVFDLPLNYNRAAAYWQDNDKNGAASAGDIVLPAEWQPWTSTWAINPPGSPTMANRIYYPQPLLSDIEFESDGSMILGFTDRLGHQAGVGQYSTNTADTALYDAYMAGDILRVCNTAGGYVLESPSNPACQATFQEAVEPTVFEYYDDNFIRDVGPFIIAHSETHNGSLALIPNGNQVVGTVMDPFIQNSAGWDWFNNSSGATAASYEIYPPNIAGGFGKASSLGDVEFLCDAQPLEIGNRVWRDGDGDGVQDPSEPAIAGVTVTLYDITGTQIASAVTDSNGQYYFINGSDYRLKPGEVYASTPISVGVVPTTTAVGGLLPNKQYQIRIDTTQPILSAYTASPANVASGTTLPDGVDSDGTIIGNNSVISLTTSAAGANNHTFDFGFVSTQGTITIVKNTSGGDGSFGFTSSNTTLDNVHLTTVGGSASSSTMTFSPGTYTITEDSLVGWTLDNVAISGADGSTISTTDLASRSAVINLDANDAITVTFSNIAESSTITPSNVLTVTKTIEGDGSGPFDIAITGPDGYITNTQINGGDVLTFSQLVQGIYTVTETSPGAGWVTTYTVDSVASATSGVVTLTNPMTAISFGPSQITGTVFNDNNSDGIITANGVVTDTGVQNVTVTIYDNWGTSVSTITDVSGHYTVTPSFAGPYRVVFTDLPTDYEPSRVYSGTQNGTTVQFIDSAAQTGSVNLGITDPNNPLLASPASLSILYSSYFSGTGVTVGMNPYTLAATSSAPVVPQTPLALFSQTGSVNGLAYDPNSDRLFIASAVRGAIPVGPYGAGAVYVVNNVQSSPTAPALSINLAAGGPAANTKPAGNVNFDLPEVSRSGLGGIDTNRTGTALYVWNLYDRTLYQYGLDPNNIATTPTLQATKTVTEMLSNAGTGCTAGLARPSAVKSYNDKLYVGVVCDASSSNDANQATDLTGAVYVTDLTNGGSINGAWSTALAPTSMAYPHARAGAYADSRFGRWRSTNQADQPQPLIADLEFTLDGYMILGVVDRKSSTAANFVYSNGDILRACPSGAQWVLEGNAGCAQQSPPSGWTNVEVPSNTVVPEWFVGDGNSGTTSTHNENSTGGLGVWPGMDEVVMTAFNAWDYAANKGGVRTLSLSTGQYKRGFNTYDYNTNPPIPNYGNGKQNLMGDVELLQDPNAVPIEIGNRVWDDLDGDGEQDAGEPGMGGLTITLVGADGTSTTTNTDADGAYYFGDLTPYTAYTLTMSGPAGYSLTAANQVALPGASVQSNHAISDTID